MSFLSSLSVAGAGFLVVFVGLAIIILFISLLSLANRQRKKDAPKAASQPVAHVVPAPVQQVATPVESGVPGDVLAAIVAAISAMMETKQGFVVRRVKRVSDVPAWSRAGREEQTYSRL